MNFRNKLFASMMATSLMFGFAAPVLAAEEISSEVQIKQHNFEAYQIFTGKKTKTDKQLTDVKWGNGINYDLFLKALAATFTEDVFTTDMTAAQVAEKIGSFKSNSEEVEKIAKLAVQFTTKNAIPFKGNTELSVDPGYYLIVDTTNANGTHDVVNTTFLLASDVLTVKVKTSKPSVNKEVLDEAEDRDTTNSSENGWGASADHNIGEVFKFKLEATIPADVQMERYSAYEAIFNDNWTKGITFVGEETVTVAVNGKTVTEGFTIDVNEAERTMKVSFADIKKYLTADEMKKDVVVTVVYDAYLNDYALVVEANGKDHTDTEKNPVSRKNKVTLEYSNNPNIGGRGETPEDTVYVFAYKLNNTKVDPDGKKLAGAEFRLYSGPECREDQEIKLIFDEKHNAYRPILAANNEEGTVMKSADEDGVFHVAGLDVGTYWLKETKAPEGYNIMEEPVKIAIGANHHEVVENLSATTNGTTNVNGSNAEKIEVVNSKGPVMPETGGMGTTIFYTAGGLLTAGAGVMLLTKKRLNGEAE